MAKNVWRVLMAVVLAVMLHPAFAAAQPAETPDEFLPVADSELQEQVPAARLVFSAYSIVWLVFAFYLFTVWRRVGQVETELRTVTARLEGNRR